MTRRTTTTSAQPPAAARGLSQNPLTHDDKCATPVVALGGRTVIAPTPDPWIAVARLSASQHGCVAYTQLSGLGLSEGAIRHAVATGRLHRIHRGVYELDLTPRELRDHAAALLAGAPATLTGRTVLCCSGVLASERRHPIDIAGIGHTPHSRPGVRVHRYGDLHAGQVRCVNGLLMTTVERALLDAADELTGDRLERAVDEALAVPLTSRTKICETAERAVGRRGREQLLALADARRSSSLSKSQAAALALSLIRQAGLPAPQTEVMLFGFPADFYFAEARLVLEVDSYSFHGLIRANFNRDRRRDRVHRQHGLEVVRVTADELKQTPLLFISDLAQAIARRLAERAER